MEEKRNVFYLAQNQTDGIVIRQDGIHHYYETIPGLRKTIPLPAGMNTVTWKALGTLRDAEETWKEVEDNDKGGEIYCRIREVTLLYTGQDLRVLLNLVVDTVQLKERIILFQLIHYDGEREWGDLLMNDGQLMKFECASVGNTMKKKWKNAKVFRESLDMEMVLKMVNVAEEIARGATGNFSLDGKKKGEKRTILMSYVTNEPFIIHTEGPLGWVHDNLGSASHALYDRFLKHSQ